MTSDFDISQYLGIFLDEADEQIQILDESIVLMEHDPDNMDLMNKIFRAAHTLKGSSASMGFEKMAQLTHAMESVLDRLRHKEMTVTTEIVNVLLKALDTLKLLKDEITSGEDQQVEVEEIIKTLKDTAQGKIEPQEPKQEEKVEPTLPPQEEPEAESLPSLELEDVEENLVITAQKEGYNVWHILVRLVPDCMMKGPRAYIVFNSLKDMGEVIKTVPTTEEIEEEKFDNSFQLVFVTKEDAYTIANTIKSISEIDGVVIEPVQLEASTKDVKKEEEPEAKPAPALETDLKDIITKAKPKPKSNGAAPKVNQTVRVDVQRLENLMNLVGELVIDRTRLLDVGQSLRNKLGSQELVETLEEVSAHIGRITTDLQEEIMKARMFPIEQVFNRFPRMVRDVAQKAGKEVDFIVEGRETELDRTVIEEIGDPLIHLLRNAIDHGIEPPEERVALGKPPQGMVRLKAFHQENQIVITVEDDGKGMDPEKIRQKAVEKGLISADAAARLSERETFNLIFLPGFSTAKIVSDVSGRGVGMDIVRTHIEKINGVIEIETAPGKGTCFTIKLPLTLAINRSLLVYLDERVFAFPLSSVVEIIYVEREKLKRIGTQEAALVRGEVLPLVKLREILNEEPLVELPEKFPVVVCALSEKRIGFVVDDLLGEQEIVIKSLGEYLGQIPGLAGATILGDGRVALILDVRGLIGQTGVENYAYAG